jgi:ribosomal protection tetracycline resistance protein
MTFRIEPGERGSGLSFRSEVSTDAIHVKYQREVERALPAALEQGLFGWQVTDLKVTLVGGEDHEIHSRPSDFLIATPMGIMDALEKAGTRLLEPMLSFSLTAPEEIGTRVLGDLVRMRAEIESPVISGGQFQVKGVVPAADSMDYPVLLGTRSGGRARMATRFSGYRECPEGFRAETPRRGIDPRDRSKYILAARKALG